MRKELQLCRALNLVEMRRAAGDIGHSSGGCCRRGGSIQLLRSRRSSSSSRSKATRKVWLRSKSNSTRSRTSTSPNVPCQQWKPPPTPLSSLEVLPCRRSRCCLPAIPPAVALRLHGWSRFLDQDGVHGLRPVVRISRGSARVCRNVPQLAAAPLCRMQWRRNLCGADLHLLMF